MILPKTQRPSRTFRGTLAALVALVSTAALTSTLLSRAALAETPPPESFFEELAVDLVNLEVVVTDKNGERITGLGKDDFVVLQDGQKVDLANFVWISPDTATPAEEPVASVEPAPEATPEPGAAEAGEGSEAAAAPPAERRGKLEDVHVVVLVDRAHLQPRDLDDLLPGLRSFLQTDLPPGSRFMLVVADRDLEVLQPFTTVPELLTARLDELAEKSIRPDAVWREIYDIQKTMDENRVADRESSQVNPERKPHQMIMRIQALTADVDREVQVSIGNLRRVIAALDGLNGRKAVLYVGGRLPINASQALARAWQRAYSRSAGGPRTLSDDRRDGGPLQPNPEGLEDSDGVSRLDYGQFDVLPSVGRDQFNSAKRFDEVAQEAAAKGIIVHTFDVATLRGGSSFDASQGGAGPAVLGNDVVDTQSDVQSAQRLGFHSALETLSDTTGGRTFFGRDVAAELHAAATDLGSYYSLGLTPLDDGETHSLEVRLRDKIKGAKLRYRKSYRVLAADQKAVEQTVASLLFGDLGNPLAVQAEVGTPRENPEDPSLRLVPVTLRVPIAKLALVAESTVHSGRLSVFFTGGGMDAVSPVQKAVVPLRIPNADLLTALGKTIEYHMEVAIPAKGERVAIGVRDDLAPGTSLSTLSRTPSIEPAAEPAAPASQGDR